MEDAAAEPAIDRYHRQRILPEIADAGQARLRAGHAVIIGCGALGSHLASTLARAGVGALTIIDRDTVAWTNLQRQTLFTEEDARDGTPKAVAAGRAIARINRDVRVDAIVDDLTAGSAQRLAPGIARLGTAGLARDSAEAPAVLLDGTDNFQTRFLLNDLAVASGAPMVYAGVLGTTGLTTTILPALPSLSPRERAGVRGSCDSESSSQPSPWRPTPCLRCLFDGAPPPGSAPTCDTAGVLGPAVSIIAGFQAAEALKILTGAFGAVRRTLLEVDAWTGGVRQIDTTDARRPDCPCCAMRRFDYLDSARGDDATVLCGAGVVQITPAEDARLDLAALADRLAPLGVFHANNHLLRGRLRESGVELTVFVTGRAIIKGEDEPSRARAIYARCVGS